MQRITKIVNPVLKSQAIVSSRVTQLLVVTNQQRNGGVPKPYIDFQAPPEKVTPLKQHIENWKYANSVFYGPDRDKENFPDIKLSANDVPLHRMWLFPDSWFQALYPKQGFLGPYVLGFGGLAFLFSKEFVTNSPYLKKEILFFWIYVPTLLYVAFSVIEKYFPEKYGAYKTDPFFEPLDEYMATIPAQLDEAKDKIEQVQLIDVLYDAKQENVQLQLEASYRERMNAVYSKVKQRLDYHLSMEETKKSYENRHLVNWVTDQVMASITPQLEKDFLASCIEDLTRMSKEKAV